MPKNKVTIKDYTSEPLTLSTIKTVYIPGPSETYDANNIKQILCTTIEELQNQTNPTSVGGGGLDWRTDSLSYKLAYYLISRYGFNVIYEGIGNNLSIPNTSWEALKYCDYNIDFITTGQYNKVATKAAEVAAYRKDCTYIADPNPEYNVDDVYELLTEMPSDWISKYNSYFLNNNAANPYEINNDSNWVPYKFYYALIESNGSLKYIPTTTKPDQWDSTFTNYYVLKDNDYVSVPPKGPAFKLNTYYEDLGASGKILLTSEPKYWDYFYNKYYIVDPDPEHSGQYIPVPAVTPTTYPTFPDSNQNLIYKKIAADQVTYVEKIRRQFQNNDSSEKATASIFGTNADYVAAFTPRFISNIKINDETIEDFIPASFGYLFAYANSTVTNPVWLAVAGRERGIIPELVSLEYNFNRQQVEILQARKSTANVDLDDDGDNVGVAINPIANIRPFGIIIYGNRTARFNVRNGSTGELKASSFLNIRNLVSLITRTAITAANTYKFDQNNSLLWNKFSSVLIPVLDSAVSGGGIVGYNLVQVATTKKARLKAKLTIVPIEAVEDLELDIILTDSLEVEVG